MIYFIGGSGRTGKSTLAISLLQRKPMMSLPTDALVSAIKYGAPEVGLRSSMPWHAKCAAARPFIEPAAHSLELNFSEALLEGDVISPEFAANTKIESRAVFLGWRHLTLAQLIEHEGPNTWVSRSEPADQLQAVRDVLTVSREVQRDCERLRLAYFDLSEGFEMQQERALAYLLDS